MPSQLINNDSIYFMCARNFTFNGKDYQMGDKFPQDESLGRIDVLVRTRRVVAVVDDSSDKPRHWHHHVWLRSDVSKKLGLIHREDSDIVGGESFFNKVKQLGNKDASDSVDSEIRDEGEELHEAAMAAAATQAVLKQENADEPDEDEETETPDRVEPGEGNDPVVDDEDQYEESDLYDPSEHGLSEVQDYLKSDITPEEKQRVIAVEKTGKNRKGIVNG